MFGDLFKDYKELKAETLSSSCFLNDGKGNFKRRDLPDELQLAPIFAFASFPMIMQQLLLQQEIFMVYCLMKEDMMQ